MFKRHSALILSAFYWRFRRQQESHAVSIFWVKMVFGLLLPMWAMLLITLFFQKVGFLRPFRVELSHMQTVLIFILWLVGWWSVHKFIQLNPSVYTKKLDSESYRAGNTHAFLLLALSVIVNGCILLNLGNL